MFHVKRDESGVHEPDSNEHHSPPPPEVPVAPHGAATIFGDRLELAERYCASLGGDGVVLGFIGPREIPRLWDRHLMNCAVLGDAIGANESVVDIGSGAGLPGIPLAIARPDLTITLVEPLLRRSDYLRRIVEELGLEVTVIRGRAEERAVIEAAGDADVVTSRAVAPLERLAKWSAPLIRTGGRLVAIKGSSASEEIARDGAAVGRLGVGDLRVETCGASVVDPPTTVIVGTKHAVSGRDAGRSSRSKRKR